jgi:hypothetical protein
MGTITKPIVVENIDQNQRLYNILHPLTDYTFPCYRPYTVVQPIYLDSTGLHSFSAVSDIRFLSLPSILASNTGFSNMSLQYFFYCINSIILEYVPAQTNENLPGDPTLLITINSEGPHTNPVNSKIINTSKLLTIAATQKEKSLMSFTGPKFNLKHPKTNYSFFDVQYPVGTNPTTGDLLIGSDSFTFVPSLNTQIGYIHINFMVVLSGAYS